MAGTAVSSGSVDDQWWGASFLLATDIAGEVHCYLYREDGDPVLRHLWTRQLNADSPVESDTEKAAERRHSSAIEDAAVGNSAFDTSRVQCVLSPRFRKLQASYGSPRACVQRDGPIDATSSSRKRQPVHRGACSAYESTDTYAFEDTHSSNSICQSAPLGPQAVSASSRTDSSGTRRSETATQRTLYNTTNAMSAAVAAVATPEAADREQPPCPFCSSSSSVASLPSPPSLGTTVSAATATSKSSAAFASPTGTRAVRFGASTGTAAAAPSATLDFMACVPDPLVSVVSAPTAAVDHHLPSMDGAAAVAASAGSGAEVEWYWRSPVGSLQTSHGPAAPGLSENAAETPVWVPLREAVRQWGLRCCHHHRLLLLRKMEETFHEVDLLTGASLSDPHDAADLFAAAAAAGMSMSESQLSSSLSSPGGEQSASSTSSSSSLSDYSTTIETRPRAVVALTVRRSQAVVVHAPTPSQPSRCTGKRQKKRKASSMKSAPVCLLKLAAPVVQFSVTCNAQSTSPAFSVKTESEEEEGEQEGACGSTACPSTAPFRPQCDPNSPAQSSSSSSSSHRNSTSASDIDMDILSGRKRLPPRYRFVRQASSDSASTSSTASSMPSADAPEHQHNETENRGENPNDNSRCAGDGTLPICCGPNGEVFACEALRGRMDGSASGEESDGCAPLLKFAVPVVQAVWVTLPPSASSTIPRCLPSGQHSACGAALVRAVPWLPEHACTLPALGEPAHSVAVQLHYQDGERDALGRQEALSPSLRGYLLSPGYAADRPSSWTPSQLANCPQVFRPLSALDVLHAAALFPQRPNQSFLTLTSHYIRGEGTGAELAAASYGHRGGPQGRRSGSGSSLDGMTTLRHLVLPGHAAHSRDHSERHGQAYPTAHVRRECPRDSSASSAAGDASVAQRIAPPHPHFIPATSFFDENFEPLTILGKGVGGVVLLARHRVTGVFYAVKVLVARDYETERDILQEVRVHAMLENKYVVRYHACWSEVISATRAQQLAFIGVCHPREANVARHQRLTASVGRPPRMPGASPRRGEASRVLVGGAAAGGWGRLMLPSHSSLLLIGSETTSETVSPRTTGLRTGTRMQPNTWSTAVVDEYAGDEEEEEEAEEEEENDDIGSRTPNRNGGGQRPTRIFSPAANASRGSAANAGGATASWPRNQPKAAAAFSDASEDEESSASTTSSIIDSDEDTTPRRSGHTAGERDTIIGSRVVFLQMEFCQVTLAHHLSSRGHISRVENLLILLQIVSGLRYLHSRGVLHRDLKPTNVFMDYRCQYDKILHDAHSSSSSSSSSGIGSDDELDSGFAEGRRANGWGNGPHTSPPSVSLRRSISHTSGSASELPRNASWGASSDNVNNGSCNAVSLRPRCPFPFSPPASSGRPGHAAALASFFPSADPVTLDSASAWEGERGALDVVLRTTHKDASALLQSRLRRRPPPAAAQPLLKSTEGKRFLQHLSRWLCRHFVQVRLGDFGLAKFLYQQDMCVDGFVSLNASNTVGVGSPLYASPEQLKGSRCTPASDAFAVGVMMAEMYLQPTTIAERLTVLREVRDGVYEDAAMVAQYPELKLVRRLTLAQPERRVTLAAAQTALKMMLLKALQEEVHSTYA